MLKLFRILVPGGGVEPPRSEDRRILSPLRLPVPPSRLTYVYEHQLNRTIAEVCGEGSASRPSSVSHGSVPVARQRWRPASAHGLASAMIGLA